MADAIDKSRLRDRVALDTSVMIGAAKALAGKSECHDDDVAGLLWKALLETRATIVLPTPVIVELHRRGDGPPGYVDRVEPAALDQPTAILAGTSFPVDRLKEIRDASEDPKPKLNSLKFDALVVACAKRHKAILFVSNDGDQRTMAKSLGLDAVRPLDLLHSQTEIFSTTPETHPRESKPEPPAPAT